MASFKPLPVPRLHPLAGACAVDVIDVNPELTCSNSLKPREFRLCSSSVAKLRLTFRARAASRGREVVSSIAACCLLALNLSEMAY